MTQSAALSAEMQTFSSSFSKLYITSFILPKNVHWSETWVYTEELYQEAGARLS